MYSYRLATHPDHIVTFSATSNVSPGHDGDKSMGKGRQQDGDGLYRDGQQRSRGLQTTSQEHHHRYVEQAPRHPAATQSMSRDICMPLASLYSQIPTVGRLTYNIVTCECEILV